MKEPFYFDYDEAEVGSTWEIETFEAVMHPINGDVACRYGE